MPDYKIDQGSTFRARLLWMQPTVTVKSISAITKSVRPTVTAAAHGIPADVRWPVWIRGVKGGMSRINHDAAAVVDAEEAYQGQRVDDNTLTIDADTTDYAAYTSGGELVYRTPVDLSGCTARMQIRRRIGDAEPVLSLLSTTAAPASRLTLDASGIIDIEISDEDTAAIDWASALWDIEVVHPDGSVTRVASGKASLSREVTR